MMSATCTRKSEIKITGKAREISRETKRQREKERGGERGREKGGGGGVTPNVLLSIKF